ncbi:ribonuclease domain-containing protein [Streptomyces syringium]|uniref:ribonuclease domain-containing protein n=1 Tax=Streptomyces syringium TaxID=76729 RepID=UPI003D909595
MTTPHRLARTAALAVLASTFLFGTAVAAPAATAAPTVQSTIQSTVAVKNVGNICYSALPSQAHDTLRLIQSGGPFPYPKDGTVFSNREGVLPKQGGGYYHEYTVKTPGSPDRGARRIVTGKTGGQEDYYTGDHYRSFDLVDHSC